MSYFQKKPLTRTIQYIAAGATSLAFTSGALLAEELNPAAGSEILEEVIVTGTLIRGVEAIGSQTIGLDRNDIIESGAVTTNELLATVPQVSNFFNQRAEQDPRGADRLQINRPNLRNLPGINSASGGTTLVLVDGHRMTSVGVDQSSVDPDIIPAGVIERVALVTDGGSSIYGADAVGGVINFVTIKEFEGVEIDLGYDTGDNFDSSQASILAGTKWDGGSGYISLGTTDRDDIQNNDRDWAAAGNWNEDGTILTPDGTECLTPVGAVTSWYWYGAGWTSNPAAPGAGVRAVGDPCDIKGEASLLPKQERDNVYAGLVQEITDGVTLEMKAYYMKRNTEYSNYPRGDTVAQPSPSDLGLVGENTGDLYDTAQVGFSYGANSAYQDASQTIDLETWGISPELTIELGNSWELRNTLHYGQSDNKFSDPKSNREKLIAYVDDGQLDPLNVGAADASVINDILDWEAAGETMQELFFVRSIADGEVLDLPAGKLRAAIGVEYTQEDAKKRKGDTTLGDLSNMPYSRENRDVKSVFTELSIPVLDTLDISLSVRYDDYSDFGDTTNPNVGFSFDPVKWLTIYGKWGEAFNAPTVLDSLGTANGRYIFGAVTAVPDPSGEHTNPSRTDVFLLEGASGALQPQTADIWSVGFDLMPLDGLTLNVNYYEIDFKQLLGAPNPQDPQAVLLNPDKFIFDPTQAEWDEFVGSVDNSDQFADLDAEGVGVIVDRRISNTEEAKLTGFDIGAQYIHDSAIGTLVYGVYGNYQSKFDLTQSGTVVDQLEFEPDLLLTGNVAWRKNNMRARLTLNYTDEYDANSSAVNQTKVDSFLVTDLYMGYDFTNESGIAQGLSLRFNINNLFDEDPPEYRKQQNLNYSGFTLGRVFKLGVTKKF